VKFQRAEPSFHYRTLRLVSEAGRWELGLSPYSHGMRLRMGRSGRPPSVLDFCLGHETRRFLPVLSTVTQRLGPLAESASAREIDAVFPWAGTRPDLAEHLTLLLAPERAKEQAGSAGSPCRP
jgi:hypothetical protein